MNILEKLKSKTILTEDEIYHLVREDYDEVFIKEEEAGEHDRWSEPVDLILETIEGEFYSIWYHRGLTEYQEDYYEAQIAEHVRPAKKIIEVIEWEIV